MVTSCGRQENAPAPKEKIHIVLPGTCECGLMGRDMIFADVALLETTS